MKMSVLLCRFYSFVLDVGNEAQRVKSVHLMFSGPNTRFRSRIKRAKREAPSRSTDPEFYASKSDIEANMVDEVVDIRLEEMNGPWNQADDPRWFVLGILLLDELVLLESLCKSSLFHLPVSVLHLPFALAHKASF
ncbi:hypothetical protein KQX54_021079 [Cotesia glomerata]|uniref:Uncharacterized protein n=1 Tax=Cotesia glomerata TaxID=32391 RepID=A0AAV7J649_COTGL|nr:hypothetical protein KQX54_021079 [Cotesia glomerata]